MLSTPYFFCVRLQRALLYDSDQSFVLNLISDALVRTTPKTMSLVDRGASAASYQVEVGFNLLEFVIDSLSLIF